MKNLSSDNQADVIKAFNLKAKFQCHPARNLLSIRQLTVLPQKHLTDKN